MTIGLTNLTFHSNRFNRLCRNAGVVGVVGVACWSLCEIFMAVSTQPTWPSEAIVEAIVEASGKRWERFINRYDRYVKNPNLFHKSVSRCLPLAGEEFQRIRDWPAFVRFRTSATTTWSFPSDWCSASARFRCSGSVARILQQAWNIIMECSKIIKDDF